MRILAIYHILKPPSVYIPGQIVFEHTPQEELRLASFQGSVVEVWN